jgi:colanic acid biosynthesis glycosyl transferase WcaI
VHVLFINRSYFPDVEATGQLLAELCDDLSAQHEITVIAGTPNFVAPAKWSGLIQREQQGRVTVLRVRSFRFNKVRMIGRILGLLSYLLLAFWAALRVRRPDVIVVETDPPLLGVAGALLKRWHRCRMLFYLQDLFPEVGLILGKLKPGLLATILRRATQIGLNSAERIVVLGEDMRRRVLQRGIDPAKVRIVPNWADTSAVRPPAGENPMKAAWGVQDRFVVMYSGNLGLSQGLDHVLTAASMLRDRPVLFLFVGEGAAKNRLIARVAEEKLENVRFLPYQPKERLGESLTAADVHLIPLQRGLAGYIVPSKLYGILAAGKPYIAAVDEESEVATITAQGQTGVRIEPDSPTELAASVRWCLENRSALAEMGLRGRDLAVKYFDRKNSSSLFADALAALATGSDSSEHAISESGVKETIPLDAGTFTA